LAAIGVGTPGDARVSREAVRRLLNSQAPRSASLDQACRSRRTRGHTPRLHPRSASGERRPRRAERRRIDFAEVVLRTRVTSSRPPGSHHDASGSPQLRAEFRNGITLGPDGIALSPPEEASKPRQELTDGRALSRSSFTRKSQGPSGRVSRAGLTQRRRDRSNRRTDAGDDARVTQPTIQWAGSKCSGVGTA
jgi:hypothetical protein